MSAADLAAALLDEDAPAPTDVEPEWSKLGTVEEILAAHRWICGAVACGKLDGQRAKVLGDSLDRLSESTVALYADSRTNPDFREIFRAIRQTIDTFAPGLDALVNEGVEVFRSGGAAAHTSWLGAQRAAGRVPWIGNLPANVQELLRRIRASSDGDPAARAALREWMAGTATDATLPEQGA